VVFAANAGNAQGVVCLPADNVLRKLEVTRRGAGFALTGDPLAGKATSTVRLYSQVTR
jgi:hypothetical protein